MNKIGVRSLFLLAEVTFTSDLCFFYTFTFLTIQKMPYNETFAIRIRNVFYEKNVDFTEKKMFSGICFMVDDKMCCGTHMDKKTSEDILMCRIGEDEYEKALENEHCIPMEFTGKPMKGYIYVTENGLKKTSDLDYWLQLCLNYNPLAKKSKK